MTEIKYLILIFQIYMCIYVITLSVCVCVYVCVYVCVCVCVYKISLHIWSAAVLLGLSRPQTSWIKGGE
jgi:hypothetical protein